MSDIQFRNEFWNSKYYDSWVWPCEIVEFYEIGYPWFDDLFVFPQDSKITKYLEPKRKE